MSCCPLCGGNLKQQALWILRDRGIVGRGDVIVPLPRSEWELLMFLYEKRPRVATKEEIMEWLYQLSPDDPPEIKIVDVFICKIRKKLKPLGISIGTHWGRGYSLILEAAPEILDINPSEAVTA